LKVVVLYYACTDSAARRASCDYRRRLNLPAGFWDAYRHLLRFAESILDRVLFFGSRWDAFEIGEHGLEELVKVKAEGRGAILLGAHFGSFQVLRSFGAASGFVINVVGDFGAGQRLNTVLGELDPTSNVNFISTRQGPAALAIQLRDAVERGELVAMLADRIDRDEGVPVDFLGAKARFPTGPYALAAVLRCPVLLTFGVYSPPNRYDLYCESFAAEVRIPRADRARRLAELAQRFADRLANFCRLEPDNWFNFYDFWGEVELDAETQTARRKE
jgi:predicted LPLAT superfamily acyltransferase